MRPHVELIQEADLCWHAGELPRGEGKVRQRNLSYDEEDGSASTRVIFDSAWNRPAGYNHSDVEWYVMGGTIKVGEQLRGRGVGVWPGISFIHHHHDVPERAVVQENAQRQVGLQIAADGAASAECTRRHQRRQRGQFIGGEADIILFRAGGTHGDQARQGAAQRQQEGDIAHRLGYRWRVGCG